MEPPDAYVLTPVTWVPHNDAYARNEESMLDWEGNMRSRRDRERHFAISDIPDDQEMTSAVMICDVEQIAIDANFTDGDDTNTVTSEPGGLVDILPILSDKTLCSLMGEWQKLGSYQTSIGATHSNTTSAYLVSDDDSDDSGNSDFSTVSEGDAWDELEHEFDDVMASAVGSKITTYDKVSMSCCKWLSYRYYERNMCLV